MKSFKLNLPIRTTDYILCILISVWTIRLGVFLLYRILKEGEDKRFRIYKKSFYSFLIPWSLSALWVFITSLTATTSILSNSINVQIKCHNLKSKKHFIHDVKLFLKLNVFCFILLFEAHLFL